MSGLVRYGSSDDEENGQAKPEELSGAAISSLSPGSNSHAAQGNEVIEPGRDATAATDLAAPGAATEAKSLSSTLIGPEVQPADFLGETNGGWRPLSPYSANRAAVRSLTMPTTPNFVIPPSPPGSPPPGIEQKFEHFLQLKAQGVHFNEKLAGSSALKNPALLQKLMASAGLEGNDQYATTLPKELWDPAGFPKWAYKEELAKSQQQVAKTKNAENSQKQRENIDFVPAASAQIAVDGVSAAHMPRNKGSRFSAAERVSAGLDGQMVRSAHASDRTFRSELERRNGRRTDAQSRPRSRSPRRR